MFYIIQYYVLYSLYDLAISNHCQLIYQGIITHLTGTGFLQHMLLAVSFQRKGLQSSNHKWAMNRVLSNGMV